MNSKDKMEYITILRIIVGTIKELDPQSTMVDPAEKLINIFRLLLMTSEVETLRKSFLEEVMKNPTIKTFQNSTNKE